MYRGICLNHLKKNIVFQNLKKDKDDKRKTKERQKWVNIFKKHAYIFK